MSNDRKDNNVGSDKYNRTGPRWEKLKRGESDYVPLDPAAEKEFIQSLLDRRRQYIESGKLEILGPRHWKWRIDFPKKTDS